MQPVSQYQVASEVDGWNERDAGHRYSPSGEATVVVFDVAS